jgi:hypothetical protein
LLRPAEVGRSAFCKLRSGVVLGALPRYVGWRARWKDRSAITVIALDHILAVAKLFAIVDHGNLPPRTQCSKASIR